MYHSTQSGNNSIDGLDPGNAKSLYVGRAGYGSSAGINDYVVTNQANLGQSRLEGQRGSLGQVKYQGTMEYRRKSQPAPK